MAFGLKLRHFPKKEIEERVNEAAQILGLTQYLKRRPKALSGGQRQRVAVGRAIVRKPKVFLFDEPLSNLDAKMRVQMRTELCQLHARIQATMVYVTHDQVEAMTMGDRIVVMNDGVIQQVDEPMQVYHKPENIFVAGFIGSPPMNFFECEFKDGKLLFQDKTLEVSDTYKSVLHDLQTKKVVVGIRPEDLEIVKNENEAFFLSTVDIVEPLGSESLIHGRTDGTAFVAKSLSHVDIHLGDQVLFTTAKDSVNLYHPETGKALH
jgi:multiple sugar transport system ATP-binding protein